MNVRVTTRSKLSAKCLKIRLEIFSKIRFDFWNEIVSEKKDILDSFISVYSKISFIALTV